MVAQTRDSTFASAPQRLALARHMRKPTKRVAAKDLRSDPYEWWAHDEPRCASCRTAEDVLTDDRCAGVAFCADCLEIAWPSQPDEDYQDLGGSE